MAYPTYKDSGGNIRSVKTVSSAAAGTNGDPDISLVVVDSATSLPLPTGASTEATLSSLDGKVTACNTGAVVVSSSALPTGAATAAKQPALGTAGTASADVITVQGIASGTPVIVDSELPAAAALSDALSNPTTPQIGADLLAWDGVQWVRIRVPSTYKDLNALAIGSITTVWTPASGKKVRIMGGSISVSAAVSILIEDNSGGTTVFRTPKLVADSPYNFDIPGGRLLAAANNVLKFTSSAAANITGTIWGTEE